MIKWLYRIGVENMRKKIFRLGVHLLMFVSFFSFGFLLVNAQDKVQSISYKKLFDVSLKDGYESFQGMTITDKYIIIAMIKNDNSKSALFVYDKNSYNLVNLENMQNPIETYDIGHANDMTFNKEKNEVYIIKGNEIVVIDSETFNQKESIPLSNSYGGITLNKDKQFIFQKNNKIYIMKDNVVQNEFDAITNLTHQNISYFNGNIFHTCYEYGKVGLYQPVYDGVYEAGTNLIYVYDESGNQENILFIPTGYGEIEALEFDENGIPFVLFNSPDKYGTVYIPIYNDAVVKISVSDESTTDDSTASLVDKNGNIETVNIKDGVYNFQDLVYYEPGVYEYFVLKSINNLERTSDESIRVTVKVTYDATTNQLIANSEYEKSGFTKDEVIETPIVPGNTSNEILEEEIVENPQTGNYFPFYILPIILGAGLVFVLFKRKFFFKL